jgi:hypothetical protein
VQSEESYECQKSILQFLDDLKRLSDYKGVEKRTRVNTKGSRWVSKKKRDAEEHLLKFKSRLAPLEYQQKYWIDYEETFALLAMNGTNRLLFLVAGN